MAGIQILRVDYNHEIGNSAGAEDGFQCGIYADYNIIFLKFLKIRKDEIEARSCRQYQSRESREFTVPQPGVAGLFEEFNIPE